MIIKKNKINYSTIKKKWRKKKRILMKYKEKIEKDWNMVGDEFIEKGNY